MPRNRLLSQLAPVLIALTAAAAVAAPPLNVVFILVDDLGWNDLSSPRTSDGNGSLYHQTPNIDALAEQGLAFTSAYAQQSCSPTRAAILTGQFAIRNGIYAVSSLDRASNPDTTPIIPPNVQFGDRLRSQPITLAEAINGTVTTAHFGKFHVTRSPEEIIDLHGFDFNFGGTNNDGLPGSYFANNADGTWRFNDPRIGPELDPYALPYTQGYIDANLAPFANGADVNTLVDTPKHLNDAMADAVEDFIAQQVAAGTPFFAHISYHAVHTDVQARPDLREKYLDLLAGGSPDPRHANPFYAALLEGLDHSVGRILRAIDDPNGDGDTTDSIADNTVVLFMSDNGGFAGSTDNAPLRGAKSGFYDGGIRVPFIVRAPDLNQPAAYLRGGEVTDHVIHAVDLYPTVLDWVGASAPPANRHVLEGTSVTPVLQAEPDDPRDPVFYHYPGYLLSIARPISVIIATAANGKRYKLSYTYNNSEFEFYNIGDDPREAVNLLSLGTSILPSDWAAAVELSRDLRTWLDQQGAEYGTWRATGLPVQPPPILPPDAPGGACNPADMASPLGVFNIDDVAAFLNAYATGSLRVDFAPVPSGNGTLDIDDVIQFLAYYAAGCP